MFEYPLKEDRIIGHNLIIYKKCLCRKKLLLRDVYYNELIGGILGSRLEIDSSELYEVVKFDINNKITANLVENLGLDVGKGSIEGRINLLQFQLTNAYLKRALNILRNS